MQVGIISDIHGNAPALAAVLRDLCGVQALICLGDAVGYYPFSRVVCAALRQRCTASIVGNHDRYVEAPPSAPNSLLRASMEMTERTLGDREKAWLSSLPETLHLSFEGVRLLAAHGSPWEPVTEYVYPDNRDLERFQRLSADIVLLGHTHRAMHIQVGDVLVVNPGSVGQPRDGDPRAAYAILDTRTRSVRLQRVRYKSEGVIRRLPQWYKDPNHVRRLAGYIAET